MSGSRFRRIGVEIEMVSAHAATLLSHPVDGFFERLARRRAARGMPAQVKCAGGRAVGVMSGPVFSSIDNAFNNLESAIGPLECERPLLDLAAVIEDEFEDVLAVLAEEDATVLNFAQHPAAPLDEAFYRRVRAPKPIYDHWVRDRGWVHWVGIDAKAQNGPNVDVAPHGVVRGLNVALALAPALIALYANSPFEGGRPTGLKENRLTIWPRMFAGACFAGDRRLARLPERPFVNLKDYLTWMLGPGTAMQIVPRSGAGLDYKGMADVVRIDGDPPALEFLRGGARPGRSLLTGEAVTVAPSISHLEFLQFSQFLDARIRWRFDAEPPTLEAFWGAFNREGGLEALFDSHLAGCYVECRAIGANLPDLDLAERAQDLDVLSSVVVSATAVMTGLLRRLAEAESLVRRRGWGRLAALRAEAIRHGLAGGRDGETLATLADEVLALAWDGLLPDERWMLAYPLHVLRTGRTGADRALDAFERGGAGDACGRILTAAAGRTILPLHAWRHTAPDQRRAAQARA